MGANSYPQLHRRFTVNIHLTEDLFTDEISLKDIKLPIAKSYHDDLFSVLIIG